MKGSLYLIGGGEIRTGETAEIDDVLKTIAPKGTKFVFFGTAAGDSLGYTNSIKSVFSDDYCVIVPTEQDGPEFARSAIESASIIYLGGGKTDLLLDLFEKWKLVELLQNALDRGTHLVGMSAGAQALSTWYAHEDGSSMELQRGWGFLPLCTLVHAHMDSIAHIKKTWEENIDLHENSLIAIGEAAAWCVSPTGTQKIGPGKVWQIL